MLPSVFSTIAKALKNLSKLTSPLQQHQARVRFQKPREVVKIRILLKFVRNIFSHVLLIGPWHNNHVIIVTLEELRVDDSADEPFPPVPIFGGRYAWRQLAIV